MSEQPTLFPVPTADYSALTDRQRFVYDLLCAHPLDGLEADEVGAALCERAGRHDRGSRCDWDAVNGRSVLRALRKKGMAKKPRAKGWVPLGTEGAENPVEADPFPEGY